ncbi:hypothetical protein DERF_002812 [Dermatophagoides farinae]|uniref:Uncharacterized protein n=1 Tax=Dermatophagoides farinae TaxID=6954 RepID=A0A922ID36_DERFA|nr:hypothetical protein DERF_002812 [Dermatophagoides farinae]
MFKHMNPEYFIVMMGVWSGECYKKNKRNFESYTKANGYLPYLNRKVSMKTNTANQNDFVMNRIEKKLNDEIQT